MKKNVLISACLLGLNCRYDGNNNSLGEEKLNELKEKYNLIPVCPEAYGGLTTPRIPSERRAGGVVNRENEDVTTEFEKGAEIALQLARLFDCDMAILKENSPSCGCGTVYDGTFTGRLVQGNGVTAELLKKNGIVILGESKI